MMLILAYGLLSGTQFQYLFPYSFHTASMVCVVLDDAVAVAAVMLTSVHVHDILHCWVIVLGCEVFLNGDIAVCARARVYVYMCVAVVMPISI